MTNDTYSYDLVPYPSHPFPQTHCDRLAAVARLFGLDPQPIDRCRMLELGCASGGNLVPMAESLPGSSFLGIDLSARQVADGRETIDSLGLENIDIRQLSILDAGPDLGQFDYILCHGIYSWVPDAVQDKILDIFRDCLTPHGVAYVSYNTYPGWHMRGMIRDMMVYHAGRFDQIDQRVAQARALLDFLAGSVKDEQSAYALMLKSELELLRRQSDAYLFHEHLEEFNSPIYFHEFVERARGKDLQFLSEADVSAMHAGNLPDETAATLDRVAADVTQMEQYMDFVRNRAFRQTLLCHADVKIHRSMGPDRLAGTWIASPLQPAVAQADPTGPAPLEFTDRRTGRQITATNAIAKAALLQLAARWPSAVGYDELFRAARSALQGGAGEPVDSQRPEASAYGSPSEPPALAAGGAGDRVAQLQQSLGVALLHCGVAGVLEIHSAADRFVRTVGERPEASRLARMQAESGPLVTSRRHESVNLSDLEQRVLRRLDGTQDRGALLEMLAQLVDDKVLSVERDGRQVESGSHARPELTQALDQVLERLAASALLVG